MRALLIPRRLLVVGLVLVFSLSVLVLTPKARATDPLTVSVSCQRDDLPGTFFCTSSTTGGTGEYTRTWKAIENAHFDGDIHGDFVSGTCTAGQPVTVKLVVIDSAGTKKNDQGSLTCPRVGIE